MPAALSFNLVLNIEGCHVAVIVLHDGIGNYISTAIACVCVGDKQRPRIKVSYYLNIAMYIIKSYKA